MDDEVGGGAGDRAVEPLGARIDPGEDAGDEREFEGAAEGESFVLAVAQAAAGCGVQGGHAEATAVIGMHRINPVLPAKARMISSAMVSRLRIFPRGIPTTRKRRMRGSALPA